jgi:catechol 2,3-dioxygenase-like lactoylglutathione lyase family enzyme
VPVPEENTMLMHSAPLLAFVATEKPAMARAFYQDKLRLPLTADEPFALVFNAHGTMLRVTKVEKVTPVPYTVLGWQVDDILSAVNELAERDVKFERYDGLKQDRSGVWTSPSGAKVAWFKDPDGNVLSLTQFA